MRYRQKGWQKMSEVKKIHIGEYVEKKELKTKIEEFICKWCGNYKAGEFCSDCALCKVSQVFATIALSTPHIFSSEEELPYSPDEKEE